MRIVSLVSCFNCLFSCYVSRSYMWYRHNYYYHHHKLSSFILLFFSISVVASSHWICGLPSLQVFHFLTMPYQFRFRCEKYSKPRLLTDSSLNLQLPSTRLGAGLYFNHLSYLISLSLHIASLTLNPWFMFGSPFKLRNAHEQLQEIYFTNMITVLLFFFFFFFFGPGGGGGGGGGGGL